MSHLLLPAVLQLDCSQGLFLRTERRNPSLTACCVVHLGLPFLVTTSKQEVRWWARSSLSLHLWGGGKGSATPLHFSLHTVVCLVWQTPWAVQHRVCKALPHAVPWSILVLSLTSLERSHSLSMGTHQPSSLGT